MKLGTAAKKAQANRGSNTANTSQKRFLTVGIPERPTATTARPAGMM